MRWTEISLDQPHRVVIGDGSWATLSLCEEGDSENCLLIEFEAREPVILPSAVDVSEQIECPRVVFLRGNDTSDVVTFGGQSAFRLGPTFEVLGSLETFRCGGAEEFWETELVRFANSLLVVYEAGVLMVGRELQVLWHARKRINDYYEGVDGDHLKFAFNNDVQWWMNISSGEVVHQEN